MTFTVTRYAWRPWARPLETIGFAVALLAYLLPFGTATALFGGSEAQPPPEPAWSASQELLRKHSR